MKVALVTGGNTGIGLATTRAFAKRGYKVIVNYFTDEPVAKNLQKKLGCILVKGDLTQDKTQKALLKAVRQFGRLDILINNAGINKRKNFETAKGKDWHETYDVNVVAPFKITQLLFPHLKRALGAVVNIASIRATDPNPADIAYSASKAAMVNLSRSEAKAFAPYIRVNSISPGPTRTRMQYKQKQKEILLGHLGSPEEIAQMIVAVAENTFITGTDLIVDGGASL